MRDALLVGRPAWCWRPWPSPSTAGGSAARPPRRGARVAGRYDPLPDPLHVQCSEEALWPVLVRFVCPRTGNWHNLQFICWGPPRSSCWRSKSAPLLTTEDDHGSHTAPQATGRDHA
jgi:hypothetical protein